MEIEIEPYFFYFNRLTSVRGCGIILVNKDMHAIFTVIQIIFKEADYYEEKKYNDDSLCFDTYAVDTWYRSRGENKAQTGNK